MDTKEHIKKQIDDHDKNDLTLLEKLAESFDSVKIALNGIKLKKLEA